jgi:hypothetical protein
LAIVAFWSIGPLLFHPAFEGLSAAPNYAIIATWVTMAFAALLLQRQWQAVPVAIILYALLFCIAAGVGHEGFYAGIEDVPWSDRIGIASVQALIVASPFVFAWSFDVFRERIRK